MPLDSFAFILGDWYVEAPFSFLEFLLNYKGYKLDTADPTENTQAQCCIS